MNRFGLDNDCYWLMLSTAKELEAAKDKFHFTYFNVEYFLESLAKGKTVFLNNAGGYHAGDAEEKTDIIEQESTIFPTLNLEAA